MRMFVYWVLLIILAVLVGASDKFGVADMPILVWLLICFGIGTLYGVVFNLIWPGKRVSDK